MTLAEKDANKVNRYIVAQHNNLVEANYSGNLSSRALKISRLLISSLNPDTKKLERIEVDISALKRFLGYTDNVTWGRFYSDLKDTSKQLNKEPFEIPLGKGKMLVTFFISSYTIDIPKGKIVFNLSQELAPYLLQLRKDYTSYLLVNTRKIRSVYSIRLYELLRQYSKIGKRSFEIEDLQKKVGSNYQNKYNNFKRKVILQAQKDLKKHTDLAFTFTETKTGRKVTGIDFMILGNKPEQQNPNQLSFLEDAIQTNEEKEKPAFSETIIKTLNELGISEQNIAKYLAMGFDIISGEKKKREEVINRCQTLENYYLEKLELTKHSNTNGNAAGFFVKALKEDWVNNKTVAKAKATKAAKERHAAQKKLEKLSAQIDKLSKKKKATIEPIIAELIADDNILEAAYDHVTQEMGEFMKKHLSDVLHLPIREQYKKALFVSSGVAVYLMENYPDPFKEVAAIDTQVQEAQKEIQDIRKTYPSIK